MSFEGLLAAAFRSGECLSCGDAAHETTALCRRCVGALEPASGCRRCGQHHQSASDCHYTWLPFDALHVPVALLGPARDLVHEMKTRGSRDSFETAAQVILATLDWQGLHWPRLVTWVPPGPRVGERGFDQGRELAHAIGRGLRMRPVRLLRRVNRTDQRALTRDERFDEASRAFAARTAKSVRVDSVLLVDDVTTTGASLFHASLALRESGVASVSAVALARTPRHRSGQDGARGSHDSQ